MGMVDGGKFTHHNLMKTNPMKEQFAPTDASPVRQRARMGGDPPGGNAAKRRQMEEAGEGHTDSEMQRLYGGDGDPGPKEPVKNRSDRLLHKEAKEGEKASKAELIRRINKPVQF